MSKLLILVALLFSGHLIKAQVNRHKELDVISYKTFIHPDFNQKSIEGSVQVQFKVAKNTESVSFDSGGLLVSKFQGENVLDLKQENGKTTIFLEPTDLSTYSIEIFYSGQPKRGLTISQAPKELFTVYSTSDWMICNMAPNDKAKLELSIVVPNHLKCVASGEFIKTATFNSQSSLQTWTQGFETPSYTYGLTIGDFTKLEKQHKGKTLKFYGRSYNESELNTIFQYTGKMIDFFEEKSGLSLPQSTYSQVLISNNYQEMSGFSILKENYGRLVLKDSTETNLISHELAHQWWGNRITCRSWRHFWLNEGFATYLSAAMNKELFGNEKYMKDINSYKKVYHGIKAKGLDKSLVFKNWNNPSSEDRSLVYFKGAYVLHLLSEALGDELFWKGIKYYSQKFIGQSVVTKDFQTAMEEATEMSLQPFFDKWVY